MNRATRAFVLCAWLFPFQSSLAEPHTQSSDDLFSARNHPRSRKLRSDASGLHDLAAKDVALFEENLREKKFRTASARQMKDMGETWVRLEQVKRIGDELTMLGEPAGIEIKMRATSEQQRMGASIDAYRKLPKASDLISTAAGPLQRLSQQKSSVLPQIEELLNEGKVELAADRFYDILDEIQGPLAWQNSIIQGNIIRVYTPLRTRIQTELATLYSAQGKEIVSGLRAKQIPPFDRFLENVNASVTAVGESGTAAWGGKMLTGPELVSAWMVGWRQAHVMCLRAQGLTWSLPKNTEFDPPDTLSNDYAEFHTAMLTACVKLVEADAVRVDTAGVPDLYTQYLQAFAQVLPRMADDSLASSLEPALAKLRDKSPEFSQTVAAYESATREALRWRQRQSAATLRAQQADHEALSDLLAQAAKPAAMTARTGASPQIDQLFVAAPPLVEDVSKVAVDQNAFAQQFAPSRKGDACNGRWTTYFFAESAKLEAPSAELEALKTDLLVTETALPLTLDAAVAITTAEQGYFAAVGGKVTSVEVDSQIGRLVNLENDDSLPVGQLFEPRPDQPLRQLSWRVSLEPKWAKHEYFFFTAP